MQKNVPLSKRLRKWARTPKQCYRNAWRVAMRLREEGKPAVYVEGFAVRNKSFEHGWVELDGEIIDVTLPDDDYTYFAGLRFPNPATVLFIQKDETSPTLPAFRCFGWGGEESAAFTRARLQAVIHEGLTGDYVGRLRQDVARFDNGAYAVVEAGF
jgi:hypothetical protein